MKFLRGLCVMGLLMVAGNGAVAETVLKATQQPTKQLTAKEVEMAQKMNMAYAHHIYESSCFARQLDLYLPVGLTPDETAKRLKGFQASCNCMADMVIKATGPNDVIDYVTDSEGIQLNDPDVAQNNESESDENPKFSQIRVMSFDRDTRRKCGFSE